MTIYVVKCFPTQKPSSASHQLYLLVQSPPSQLSTISQDGVKVNNKEQPPELLAALNKRGKKLGPVCDPVSLARPQLYWFILTTLSVNFIRREVVVVFFKYFRNSQRLELLTHCP